MKFRSGQSLAAFSRSSGVHAFSLKTPSGSPLWTQQVLDAELLRPLPERVGDLLVVHEPGLLAELGPGVHLPGVDLQVLDLPLHLLQLLRAEVGPQQAVRQDALRAGQVVDVLARGDHLVGRQRVLVPVAGRHAADDRHDGVAVAEDLLDVVGAVEQLQALLELSPRAAGAAGRSATVAVPCGVSSYHLRLTSTWCVWTSKMNWSLGHFSSNAFGSSTSAALDLVALAEDLVEGQQGGGHAAAGAEEVARGSAPGACAAALADVERAGPRTPSAAATAAAG